MFLSVLIYLTFIGLIFIGGQKAKSGQFNADYLGFESSKGIKGLAVIGVLLHHISQILQDSGHLAWFSGIGFIFVGIFFFFSGYGLYKSLDSKPDYMKNFFRSRMIPIAGTVTLMNVIYAVYKLIAQYEIVSEWSALRWILGFLNISLINDQGWYPFVLLLMYAVFWFAFTRFKSLKISVALITAAILIQVSLFIAGGHFAWWMQKGWYHGPESLSGALWWQEVCTFCFQGEWWVNSTLAFVMGLVWAINEKKIIKFLEKKYAVKLILIGVLAAVAVAAGVFVLDNVSFWSEFSPLGKNGDIRHMDKLICWTVQQAEIFFVISFICTARLKLTNSCAFLSMMSGISLEFYLMQRIALNLPRPLVEGESVTEAKRALYIVLVFTIDFVMAMALKFVSKKLFAKKSQKI